MKFSTSNDNNNNDNNSLELNIENEKNRNEKKIVITKIIKDWIIVSLMMMMLSKLQAFYFVLVLSCFVLLVIKSILPFNLFFAICK